MVLGKIPLYEDQSAEVLLQVQEMEDPSDVAKDHHQTTQVGHLSQPHREVVHTGADNQDHSFGAQKINARNGEIRAHHRQE